MQRVTSLLPSWDTTKTGSKKGFDKAWGWADKLGAPINRLSNKIGSEAFWPTTLDKECDKAARILKSFCKDGFYAEEDRTASTLVDAPKGKQRVLKKIPERVIQNAVGLAIFTTMRTGLWVSGAGGSGVLIARKPNGEWSPPSGILLHTAGLGFLVGVDIYDCVVVINNRKALESFTKIRATIGGEISAVAGPVGVGGVLENDGKWKQANRPVFTYLKSRGFYAGVQVDGTVVIERTDENERFYGQKVGVADILAGKVRHPPYEIKMLMETLKAAEGRNDVDKMMMDELADQPAPGDVALDSPRLSSARRSLFGIPEPDDPDPYGVLALEKEGFEIREAGSKSRPASTQFEYNPSPTSPIFSHFQRRSMDTLASRGIRESYVSTASSRTRTSTDRAVQTSEMATQTDDFITPSTSPSHSDDHKQIIEEEDTRISVEPEDIDYTKIDLGPFAHLNHSQEFDGTTATESPRSHDPSHTDSSHTDISNHDHDTDYHTDDEADDLDDEEPVIFEAAAAQATVMSPQALKARGGLVNIPKRPPPPPLPPRSNARAGRALMVDQASGQSPIRSPVKEGFEEVNVHGGDRKSFASTKSSVPEDFETSMPGAFNEKVEEVKHFHVNGVPEIHEPETAELEPDTLAAEHESSKAVPELRNTTSEELAADNDTFHSVPTTPMETISLADGK